VALPEKMPTQRVKKPAPSDRGVHAFHLDNIAADMANRSRAEIIKENPIGNGLDGFRALFASVCEDRSIPCITDSLDRLNDDGMVSWLSVNLLS